MKRMVTAVFGAGVLMLAATAGAQCPSGCHSAYEHCKPAPRGEVLFSGRAVRLTDERAVPVREDVEKELQMKVIEKEAPKGAERGLRQPDLEKRIEDIERTLLRLTELLRQMESQRMPPCPSAPCPRGYCPRP